MSSSLLSLPQYCQESVEQRQEHHKQQYHRRSLQPQQLQHRILQQNNDEFSTINNLNLNRESFLALKKIQQEEFFNFTPTISYGYNERTINKEINYNNNKIDLNKKKVCSPIRFLKNTSSTNDLRKVSQC